MCDHGVRGVQSLQMEFYNGVIGSAVDREVITINNGYHMIRFVMVYIDCCQTLLKKNGVYAS